MQKKEIWFPAKKYGWGWGLPINWRGWVFLLAWLGVWPIALFTADTSVGPVVAGLFIAAMVGLLVGVCALKGEKPRWRWGGE